MCLDYFTKGNNKHILFYSLTVYYVRPGNKLSILCKIVLMRVYCVFCILNAAFSIIL